MNPCQHDHDHLCTSMDWAPGSDDGAIYRAGGNGMQFLLYYLDVPGGTHQWAVLGRYDGRVGPELAMKFDTPHHALMQAESWMLTLGEESGLRDDLLLEVFQKQDDVATPKWDLADRLRKSLRTSGISVGRLADEYGLHRNTLSKWLNGREAPGVEHLRQWAASTRVPYEWLIHGTEA